MLVLHRPPFPVLLVLTLLLALLPARVAAQEAAPLPEGVTVVANGLDNPRNFTWDESGALVLSIAGIGGPSMGMIDGAESGLTGGPTASVVTLDDGCAATLADGLPSGLWDGVGWVWGTADVALLDGQLYQLASGGGSDYGNFETPAGVYRVDDDGTSTLAFDFSAWSRANMPAFVPPDFNADGTLNDMFTGDDGQLWIVDAVSARIFTVTPDGEATLFSDVSPDHPVPTAIVPDGGGGLFVSNLTAVPYPNGSAKVMQIAADGTVTDAWTGLTALTSLAMGPDGALYAVEMATDTIEEDPFLPPDSGRVVRQTGPDSFEEVVTGLNYPVALGFAPDGALHIAGPAFGTGAGEGQGWLLRVDPSTTLPVSLAGVDLMAPVCATDRDDAQASALEAKADTAGSAVIDRAALLQIPLTETMIGSAQAVGFTRLAIEPGATQEIGAGSGDSLLFVEAGALDASGGDSAPLSLVRAGVSTSGSAPETSAAGDVALQAGDAVILPAEGEVQLSNTGDSPATVLALLAAPDARLDAGPGTSQTVLRTDEELAAAPGLLTLERVTIPGGERLEFPDAPTLTIAVGLDPRQAMYLSGRMEGGLTNRSDVPVEAYLLSIAPSD